MHENFGKSCQGEVIHVAPIWRPQNLHCTNAHESSCSVQQLSILAVGVGKHMSYDGLGDESSTQKQTHVGYTRKRVHAQTLLTSSSSSNSRKTSCNFSLVTLDSASSVVQETSSSSFSAFHCSTGESDKHAVSTRENSTDRDCLRAIGMRP